MGCIDKIKHKKTMLFVIGALSALGFAPVYALPLFVAGMVFSFLMSDKAQNIKQAAFIGYVFGFGFYCAGFYWIANALLIDIKVFGWLYPITLIATGAFFGFFFIPPFMVWYCLKNSLWRKVLGFASSFVLCEYLRSFLLTGFPWNMMGSMFAGCEESPGEFELYQGRKYKVYRGMGSIAAMENGSKDRYFQSDVTNERKFVPEGIEGKVPYKGDLASNIYQMTGGIKSGLGYIGAKNIEELHKRAKFIQITSSGLKESHVHDVIITKEAPNYRIG